MEIPAIRQIAAICTSAGTSLTDSPTLFLLHKNIYLISSPQTHLEETENDIINKCAYERGTLIMNIPISNFANVESNPVIIESITDLCSICATA